jgi:hypothetical protein
LPLVLNCEELPSIEENASGLAGLRLKQLAWGDCEPKFIDFQALDSFSSGELD